MSAAKPAALLPSLELSSRTRANAARQSTAARGAICGAEALAANELHAPAVADVLHASGVEFGATDALAELVSGCSCVVIDFAPAADYGEREREPQSGGAED